MTQPNKTLRDRISRWAADDTVYSVVRYGALFVLFLALTMGIFFALRLWYAPELPPDGYAGQLQHGFYTLGGGALIAGLVTWAVSALRTTATEERPIWFCPLLAAALGLSLYLLGYAFLGVYPFGSKTVLMVDMHHQYAPLMSELRHMILNGGDFTYNFNIGLGAAFIPTFAYYLASPLNLILLFFSEKYLTEAIFIITLIKGMAAAGAFTAMAQYLYNRRTTSMVAVGLLYALSGFMLAYSWNIMWLDVIVLLPVVVLAMEYLLRNGKILPYACLLALALFCNYYIGFMLCVFLVLYMIVWLLRQRRTLKDAALGCVRFAAGSLWGAGMAACLLIPTALALGRTSAAGGEIGEFGTNFPLFDLLGRLFYGATPTIRSGNLPNLYCGIPAVLLAPVYLTQKEIPLRRRLCFGGLLGVLLVSCSLTQWDLVWHGLHAPNDLPYRFSFLLSFVLLMMAAHALAHLKHTTPKQILGSLAGCVIYLFLWEKLGQLTGAALPDDAEKVTTTALLLYTNVAILIGYAAILLFGALKKSRVAGRVLLVAVCLELLIGTPATLMTMNENEYFTGHSNYTYHTKHQVLDAALRRAEELAAAEAEQFGGFCRYEYLPRTTCVDTALHHYSGLTTFASSNPYLTTKLMGDLGYAINGVNSYLYNSFVAPVDSLFGLRYVVLENHISHPQLTMVDSVSATGADGQTETRYIYRNEHALPVGMAVSAEIRDYHSTKYDPFASQQALFEHLSGQYDDIYHTVDLETESEGASCSGSRFSVSEEGGEFFATITEKGQYFAFVDCRAAEDITVEHFLSDDSFGNSWKVTNHEPYIIDMGTLQENDAVWVTIDSDSHAGGNIYLARLDTEAWDSHRSALQEGAFTVTEQKGSSLTGTVTAKEEQALFFSIPYDKGWEVYVDGERVETFPIDNDEETEWNDDGTSTVTGGDDGALLGAAIPAGTHTVFIRFRAPGQLIGAAVSAVSLLLLAASVLWQVFRRRKAATATVRLADVAADPAISAHTEAGETVADDTETAAAPGEETRSEMEAPAAPAVEELPDNPDYEYET